MRWVNADWRTAVRLMTGVMVIALGGITANAQSQNSIVYPPNGGGAYLRTDTVSAYGIANYVFHPYSTMTFGTGGSSGGVTPDPNTGGGSMTVVDMGAAFGNPGMYIVWSGTKRPNATGWTPSPLGAFGFPFPIPDHAIEFAAGTSESVGPFWVF